MQLGATFSTHHLNCLNIDPLEAIKEYKKLGLKWIRLGAYWSKIEKIEGEYDFSDLDPIIKFCEKEKIKIILTVGMKAPRWPEYYVPQWLSEHFNQKVLSKITMKNKILLSKTLDFISAAINHTMQNSIIKIWQVENEPLDPAGPSWLRIDKLFLQEEINLVRELDPSRNIMVNLWGNELAKRKVYKKAVDIADIVGFDFYLKYPITIFKKFIKYAGPFDSEKKILQVVNETKSMNKEVWITELQAEPWETDGYNIENPKSFSVSDFEKNLQFALKLNPELILLWGFEYWLYRRLKHNDERYWSVTKDVILKYS